MKTDSNESPVIIVPLGKALKDARLNASLSIDEVAEKLNLGAYTVRDLEDDLDNVLKTKKYSVIYLRGYLANYAKLVGLNTLELFVEYQQLECVKKQKNTLTSSSLIIPLTKKRTKWRSTLLVIIVVIAIALLVVFNKPLLNAVKQFNPVSEASSELLITDEVTKTLLMPESRVISVAQPTAIPVTVVDITEVEESQNEVLSEANQQSNHTDDVNENSIEIKKTQVDVVEAQAVIETINNEPTPITTELELNTGVELTEEAELATDVALMPETEVNAEVVAESTAEQQDASLVENLSLAFNADCWTEVFDATGKRIAFGLYKSGRILALSGVAPFELKLGDPSVVDIQYQDKIIEGDFAPGRSAQFSVPLS